MKIKPGFELRDICGEKVIIAQGLENLDFTHLITLNESAAYVFSAIADREEFDTTTIVELLTAEYDVSNEQAKTDAELLVSSWQEQGIIA